MTRKQYSIIAILLLIVIAFRLLGSLGVGLYTLSNGLFTLPAFFIFFVFSFAYLLSFIGVLKKTRWGSGLIFVVALFDSFLALLSGNGPSIVGAFAINMLLIVFSILILTRKDTQFY